ncbi:hypothetical protein [Streptomyces fulvorobeus]|uniref:Membrane protein implicated in regulation of membrane protease activity n=1 Tax=Streptomyces fulvorobeus TaxID=284028 RepID=A0A7J0CD41_9ACTN|nr:hypothetical protein [Streptomyces fulvorobeus]NYE43830.1 membrane protein implicated in regulation of membrane protease activity [Streptomyces fulvorobeus]GFN00319.1 hypothetical protein Sfulv_51290 [Streptomyces fulvorobeus]
MGLILLALLLLLLAGPGLWFWGRSLATGRWRQSAGWFAGTAVLLLVATGTTYLVGSMAGTSLDPEESCHAVGQNYDRAYIREHFEEQTRWFPLRDACNADHDLVPVWVNPALVALPTLAVASLVYSARPALRHRQRTKKDTQ